MATDQSKLFSITNNTGKDVVIVLPVNENETTSSAAVKAANGQLELLLAGSGTVIKNGSSGTVILDRSYQPDADEQGYVKAYDLQVCDSTWLYPLIILPVTQQTVSGSAGFASQTVSTADLSTMTRAFTFYQTIAVYPGSALATGYLDALSAAKEGALAKADDNPGSAQAVSDAISKAMTRFFKSTQEYKDVTLDHVVAVDNYYKNFPAIWAQYQDSMTYYLYGSDGTTASFAGSLSLKKTGTMDVTKKNSGYTCLFTPSVNPSDIENTTVNAAKAIQLTYVNGLFVDNPDAAKPKIAFKGSFMLKRFFTMESDNNNIATVITGNISRILYVGLDTPQHSPDTKPLMAAASEGQDPDNKDPEEDKPVIIAFWDRLTHPKSLGDWAITVVTFASAIVAVPATAFVVYKIYKYVKSPSSKQVSNQTVKRRFNVAEDEEFAKAIKWTGEETLEQRSEMMADHYGLSIQKIAEISLNGDLATWSSSVTSIQRYCTKELLTYQSLMSPEEAIELQTLLTSIQASEKALLSIPTASVYRKPELLEERLGIVNRELPNITEYRGVYERMYAKIEERLSNDTKELFVESRARIDAYISDVRKTMEENTEEEREFDPEVEREIVPKEIIPIE